jgi:hypothetical protein
MQVHPSADLVIMHLRRPQLAANRPVRRIISKAKRRVISENWSNAEVDGFCFDDHITPKSEGKLAVPWRLWLG